MPTNTNTRAAWLRHLHQLAQPPLEALATHQLRATIPVEQTGKIDRALCTHLEAVGRLLCGIAPWLESSPGDAEGDAHTSLRALVVPALDAATDPASPDFLNFTQGQQPLVDTAFLAQAILRAPRTLWHDLPEHIQNNLADALLSTRDRKPAANNWLLFSATTEAALCLMGRAWDPMRVDYALRQHMQWYLGDGTYSDGPRFHWDSYNSFVIQPMLVDIITQLGDKHDWEPLRGPILDRARRYAAVQERQIAPDGTFPPLGRSLTYRSGAFHLLAQSALRQDLPPEVSPAQVRGALTAVLHRTLDAPGTFNDSGWLQIGLSGHQPGLGETYISTGSLYLCSAALLPLGLPPTAPFWSDPDTDWTSRKLWAGQDAPADHSI